MHTLGVFTWWRDSCGHSFRLFNAGITFKKFQTLLFVENLLFTDFGSLGDDYPETWSEHGQGLGCSM